MAQKIVLLSGSICVGKSTLTAGPKNSYHARVIKTRELLDIEAQHRFKVLSSREEYQAFGELLDFETRGLWVAKALSELLKKENHEFVVIDSIRIPSQIAAIRQEYKFAVFHLHLKATDQDLEERYDARPPSFNCP